MANSENKPKLHFAHANGFPAGCYRKLFGLLEPDFDIFYIEKMAHSPEFPLNDNWESTGDEIIHNIEKHANEPVIGVGHSFGSLSTLQAALKRPDLFSQIIILDPPLVTGVFTSALIYFFKTFGLMDRITPAGISKNRRQEWPSFDETFEYFRKRSLFKYFSDEAIKDYINSAMTLQEDGSVKLHYSVQIECDVFRTMPHNLEFKRTPLPIPSTLIHGDNSDVLKIKYAKRLNKFHGMKLVPTKGTHLFPMEYPEESAQTIKQVIKDQS